MCGISVRGNIFSKSSPKVRLQELEEELLAAKESVKAARGRENTLKEEVDSVNQELQRGQKVLRRLQTEKEEREEEIQALKQQIKRLSSTLQVVSHGVMSLSDFDY